MEDILINYCSTIGSTVMTVYEDTAGSGWNQDNARDSVAVVTSSPSPYSGSSSVSFTINSQLYGSILPPNYT